MSNPYANPYAQVGGRYSVAGPSTSGPQAGPQAPAAGPSYSSADPYSAQSYDAHWAEQASIYTPEASKRSHWSNPAHRNKGRTTVLKKGGGTVWEDQTLMDWDPAHYRLFVGDLDPALSDDIFQQAFSGPRFPSFVKAKLIRDKNTNKGKGFGFVSYSDPEDFLKCWKEMNGKYVGTRPVKISKATTGVSQVKIGDKKARGLDAPRKRKSGTEAFSRNKVAEAEGGGLNATEGEGALKDKKSYIRR